MELWHCSDSVDLNVLSPHYAGRYCPLGGHSYDWQTMATLPVAHRHTKNKQNPSDAEATFMKR